MWGGGGGGGGGMTLFSPSRRRLKSLMPHVCLGFPAGFGNDTCTEGKTLLTFTSCLFIPQHIDEIPDELKPLYKTVWEISQKTLIDMAADRGAFIDQSQSFNVFFAQPDNQKLTSMHFYGWKKVV